MNLIRLTAWQRSVKLFKHPMFEGTEILDADTLEALVGQRHEKGGEDTLILALRSTVRYLVGRYLWHWPASRPFLDEMVCEGMLAVTLMVRELEPEMLEDSNIQKLTSSRVCWRIENMLNKSQGVASASLWTQRERVEDGIDPIYLISEREPIHEDKATASDEHEKLEMLDTVHHIRDECSIACVILDPKNWGLTDDELSARIGVTRTTVMRRRSALLTEFLERIGENDD